MDDISTLEQMTDGDRRREPRTCSSRAISIASRVGGGFGGGGGGGGGAPARDAGERAACIRRDRIRRAA